MPEEITIKLTPQVMNRLRFVASEASVTPQEWAADSLADAATELACTIMDGPGDHEEQRKACAALNRPPKRKKK